MITSHIQERLQAFISSAAKPLVVVLGPTASGKTDFSVGVAETLEGMKRKERKEKVQKRMFSSLSSTSSVPSSSCAEIINADSRQLYRHLDIGTAKITREEMKGITHHLIDVLDPREEVTAAWYRIEAMRIINEIHGRHHIPMLVGGSMLYISAVIDGLAFPVGSDAVLRQKLTDAYDRDDGVTLHARLTEADPETALGIPRQNKPYVIRAMELLELGGKRPSALRESADCPYDLFILGIERSREELTERIDRRTGQLLKAGWTDEVRELITKGYGPGDPGMKSHGYREIMEYLQEGNEDIASLQKKISAKTRQYAKRQMTWWKGDERILWITPSAA